MSRLKCVALKCDAAADSRSADAAVSPLALYSLGIEKKWPCLVRRIFAAAVEVQTPGLEATTTEHWPELRRSREKRVPQALPRRESRAIGIHLFQPQRGGSWTTTGTHAFGACIWCVCIWYVIVKSASNSNDDFNSTTHCRSNVYSGSSKVSERNYLTSCSQCACEMALQQECIQSNV